MKTQNFLFVSIFVTYLMHINGQVYVDPKDNDILLQHGRLDMLLTCPASYYPDLGVQIVDKIRNTFCNMSDADFIKSTTIKEDDEETNFMEQSIIGCYLTKTMGNISSVDMRNEICSGNVVNLPKENRQILDNCSELYSNMYQNSGLSRFISDIMMDTASNFVGKDKETLINSRRKYQHINFMINNYCHIIYDHKFGGNKNDDQKIVPNKNEVQVMECIKKTDLKKYVASIDDICNKYMTRRLAKNWKSGPFDTDICDIYYMRRYRYELGWRHKIFIYQNVDNWTLTNDYESINIWYETLKECINPEPYVYEGTNSFAIFDQRDFCCYKKNESASECFISGPKDVEKGSKYEMCRKLIFENMSKMYDKKYILCGLFEGVLLRVALCMDIDVVAGRRSIKARDKTKNLGLRSFLVKEMNHRNNCIANAPASTPKVLL